MRKILILAATATLTTATFADVTGPTRTGIGSINIDANKPFRLEGDLGYLLSNSKSSDGSSSSKTNLNARLLFQRQVGVWGQEVIANAVSANDDKSTDNLERYSLAGKVLHRSTDTVYEFGKLNAEKDLSSSFDYQVGLTGGFGFDILKDEKQSLSTEVGAGYRFSKERVAPHDSNNEIIGTLAAFYQYKITPSVRFNQDLGYEYGQDSQTFRSRTALTTDLTKHFSAFASYNINDIKADIGNSRDSLMSLGLHYKY